MTVELRPWSRADAPALLDAVASSPDLDRQLARVDFGGVEECARFIEERLVCAGPDRYGFAVAVDGVTVGNVGLSQVERTHQTAWVHYWLASGQRGRGIAARAVATVASWALGDLGLFRLELGHRVNNPASCRVAARAGFVAEGLERAKLRYGDERFDVETHTRLLTDPAPDLEPLPMRVPGGA